MEFEWTPVRLVLPAIPILDEAPRPLDELRVDHTIRVTGLRTLPTSIEAAEREADAMLAECRTRVEGGHSQALLELLEANPAFVADSWVRETLARLLKAGRLSRRRGRPRDRRQFHPLVVVGLVEHLIGMGDAANPEQALHLLEEIRVLNYGTAKDLYYRSVRQDRFRPILLKFPELAQRLSLEETTAFLSRVEVVQPGRPVHRKTSDPLLGDGDLTVQAV